MVTVAMLELLRAVDAGRISREVVGPIAGQSFRTIARGSGGARSTRRVTVAMNRIEAAGLATVGPAVGGTAAVWVLTDAGRAALGVIGAAR